MPSNKTAKLKESFSFPTEAILSSWHHRAIALFTIIILFLIFFNLTAYPRTWYDEGSHLHVPKTLVNDGVYADFSSEGYRYYGPAVGVGPTMLLPIAASFLMFGTGLFQARVIITFYLLGTIYLFYKLGSIHLRLVRRRFAIRVCRLSLAIEIHPTRDWMSGIR